MKELTGNGLMDKLTFKKRHLIIDENDIVEVLTIINTYHRIKPSIKIGKYEDVGCTKWFIKFTTNDEKWNFIRKDLNIIRAWDENDIPEKTMGKIYSTD